LVFVSLIKILISEKISITAASLIQTFKTITEKKNLKIQFKTFLKKKKEIFKHEYNHKLTIF